MILEFSGIGSYYQLNTQDEKTGKNTNNTTNADQIDPDFEVKRMSAEDIQQRFPELFNELIAIKGLDIGSEEVQLALQKIESQVAQSTKDSTTSSQTDYIYEDQIPVKIDKDYLQGFTPEAKDFLRRATTSQEAIEVIDYLEINQQLTTAETQKLRSDLDSLGLNTLIKGLGGFKKDGYYFDIQQKRHLEEKMKLSKKI